MFKWPFKKKKKKGINLLLSATKTNSITYALVWDKLKTDKTSGDVTSGEEDEEDKLRAEVTAALRWTPPFSAPPPKPQITGCTSGHEPADSWNPAFPAKFCGGV